MLQQLLRHITKVMPSLVDKRLKRFPYYSLDYHVSFCFFLMSRYTSFLDLATFNALARNSVFCLKLGKLNNSLTAKWKDYNFSQSDSSRRSSRFIKRLSRRCMKSHICLHKKTPWSPFGSSDPVNASRYSWTTTLNNSKRASKKRIPGIVKS